MMKRRRLAIIVCLLYACAWGAWTDDDLLFRVNYRESFNAVFSRGNGKPYVPEGLLRRGIDGRHGLSLPHNQLICYEASGNLDLSMGTVMMEVTPTFTSGRGELPFGGHDAHLFALRNRLGQRLNVLLNNRNGMVYFYVSNRNGGSSSCKVDVRGWQAGERRMLRFSWRRPSQISLWIEGFGEAKRGDADLPECPAYALHDFYIGSNAQGLPRQQYGSLGTWPGSIAECRIYRSYGVGEMPALPPSQLRNSISKWPSGVHHGQWHGKNGFRQSFYLQQTRKSWHSNPVKIPVDLSADLGNLSLARRRKVIRSMRLVASDPVTGKVLTDNQGRIHRPFQFDDDFPLRMSGDLCFVHVGALPVVYNLYYDGKAPYETYDPVVYPLPGFGLPLMVGTKSSTGNFGGGLRGSFAVHDFDGDGDPDLLFLSGSLTDSGRDLFNGLYYYENLRTTCGYDLFSQPVLVERGNNEFGHLRQTAPPRLVDLDGDGRLDCVFAASTMPAYAQIRMVKGMPQLYDWKALRFDGPMPPLVSSAALHDFDGDGLVDIFSDGLLYRNVGTVSQPVFSSKGQSMFATGVVNAKEKQRHQDMHKQAVFRLTDGSLLRPLVWEVADLTGDGLPDLLCGGWKSQLYCFPQNQNGKFQAPQEVRTEDGHELAFPGVFPFPLLTDWDGDGDLDLLLSSEDGTLGLSRNNGNIKGPVQFSSPILLPESRSHVNAGALAVPVAVDWNGDGQLDLLAGAANGRVYVWNNQGTTAEPILQDPTPMNVGGNTLLWRAGPRGSLQGEQENDWGYVNLEVADWDLDGRLDVLLSGVWGRHRFYRNIGSTRSPRLTAPVPIEVDFTGKPPVAPGIRFVPQGNELITVHRCRPSVWDWNGDGLPDYVAVNHRDRPAVYLRYRRKDGSLGLKPGTELNIQAPFFRSLVWNHPTLAGLSSVPPKSLGRCVLHVVDWDRDGKPDLLMDALNGRLLRQEGGNFVDQGDLADERLANHNTAPYAVDLDGDGKLDLIVGTESGFVHGFLRSYLEKDTPKIICGEKEVAP